jgi:hypothetical protein
LAAQPDGLLHVILGRDRWRSICGLRLRRYAERYGDEDRYGSLPNCCPQCARILAGRAKFPAQTSTEQKAVIDRIQKLLALAERENTNEHEAVQAAARADELVKKHNLSLHVLEDPSQQKAEKRSSESLGIRVDSYKYILAQAVCCQHDVEYYRHQWSREKYLVFIGLAANVETAVLTHAYWCGAVEASYRAARHGNSSALNTHDYKQGFAENILHRVRAARREAANDPSVAALIRIGSEVARRAMDAERLLFGGGFSYSSQVRNQEAYQRGYRDGGRVDLHGARTSRLLDEAGRG